MSDGETIEQAIANGMDAIQCWIAIAKEKDREIPDSGDIANQSGKWVQCVPRSLHAKLTRQAKCEHVSLNTVSILSESVGFKSSYQH
jgi:antitoxin HicB